MNAFTLKIVTPDGLKFEGQALELIVRSTSGDIGIMAGHINCVVPLGMGRATIKLENETRYSACIGGMLSVIGGNVTLVPTTFEWTSEIDIGRAERSEQNAQSVLNQQNVSKTDILLAQARLHRALVRKDVAKYK